MEVEEVFSTGTGTAFLGLDIWKVCSYMMIILLLTGMVFKEWMAGGIGDDV